MKTIARTVFAIASLVGVGKSCTNQPETATDRTSRATADCSAVYVDLYDLPADAYVTTGAGATTPGTASVTNGEVHGKFDIGRGNYGDVKWEVTAYAADRTTVLFQAGGTINCPAPLPACTPTNES